MIIGFSTGSIAMADVRRGLEVARHRRAKAVELSALREEELDPLLESLDRLEGDLKQFEYISFHAPSRRVRFSESEFVEKLRKVAKRGWAIVVHPDVIDDFALWRELGKAVCIENMDKRKPTGRTAAQLQTIFEKLPEATFCFDIGHARQVDPTMQEAETLLQSFGDRLRQVHMSHVNSQSRHERLNFESIRAFQRVAHRLNDAIPIILETPVKADEVDDEIASAEEVFSGVQAASGEGIGEMSRLIPERESLTVEFKSDRLRLPDRDLVSAVVCLANSEGGEIYVGVEEDGTVTGLHPSHQNVTGVVAVIANQTSPPLTVRAEVLTIDNLAVAKIMVPKARQLVATTEGLLQRRRLKADGTPECVPLYPHEIAQRQSDLGLLDYSALPVLSASLDDFDPLERERLRGCIERYGGDRSLVGLADAELDGALGLVRREETRMVPTVAGMLILGKEAALRRSLPTHEVAFQVMEGTDVRVNEFRRMPLLKTFEWVEQQFAARLVEHEIQLGLFRVPVPNYDPRAFREALVNALIHREYTRLGAVHIRWETDAIVISNPGGFVEGVTLANLLVVEPRPRNPLLADAIKRIGLAERTGRGIDLIYQGMLRYGRPAPNYSRTDSNSVVVILDGGQADVGMLRTVVEEEKRLGYPLPVDSLITLSLLRQERRADTARLAQCIQKDEATARRVIERLVEAGLVQAHGVKKGRTYTLSPKVYQGMGKPADYVRQAGFNVIQQEQMILQYVQTHGRITRKDVSELCRINEDQSTYLLRKLRRENKLQLVGKGRGAYYREW